MIVQLLDDLMLLALFPGMQSDLTTFLPHLLGMEADIHELSLVLCSALVAVLGGSSPCLVWSFATITEILGSVLSIPVAEAPQVAGWAI